MSQTEGQWFTQVFFTCTQVNNTAHVRAFPYSYLLERGHGAPTVAHFGLKARAPRGRKVLFRQRNEIRNTYFLRHVSYCTEELKIPTNVVKTQALQDQAKCKSTKKSFKSTDERDIRTMGIKLCIISATKGETDSLLCVTKNEKVGKVSLHNHSTFSVPREGSIARAAAGLRARGRESFHHHVGMFVFTDEMKRARVERMGFIFI